MKNVLVVNILVLQFYLNMNKFFVKNENEDFFFKNFVIRLYN